MTGIVWLDTVIIVSTCVGIGFILGYGIGQAKGYNDGFDSGQMFSEKAFQQMIEANNKYFGCGE